MIFRLLLFWLSTSFFQITRNVCSYICYHFLFPFQVSAFKGTKSKTLITWCCHKIDINLNYHVIFFSKVYSHPKNKFWFKTVVEGLSYCADVGVFDHVVGGRWPTSVILSNIWSLETVVLLCLSSIVLCLQCFNYKFKINIIFISDFLKKSRFFWLNLKNVFIQ